MIISDGVRQFLKSQTHIEIYETKADAKIKMLFSPSLVNDAIYPATMATNRQGLYFMR